MYTISPLYQIINLNVSTWYLKPLNIKWDPTLFKMNFINAEKHITYITVRMYPTGKLNVLI